MVWYRRPNFPRLQIERSQKGPQDADWAGQSNWALPPLFQASTCPPINRDHRSSIGRRLPHFRPLDGVQRFPVYPSVHSTPRAHCTHHAAAFVSLVSLSLSHPSSCLRCNLLQISSHLHRNLICFGQDSYCVLGICTLLVTWASFRDLFLQIWSRLEDYVAGFLLVELCDLPRHCAVWIWSSGIRKSGLSGFNGFQHFACAKVFLNLTTVVSSVSFPLHPPLVWGILISHLCIVPWCGGLLLLAFVFPAGRVLSFALSYHAWGISLFKNDGTPFLQSDLVLSCPLSPRALVSSPRS